MGDVGGRAAGAAARLEQRGDVADLVGVKTVEHAAGSGDELVVRAGIRVAVDTRTGVMRIGAHGANGGVYRWRGTEGQRRVGAGEDLRKRHVHGAGVPDATTLPVLGATAATPRRAARRPAAVGGSRVGGVVGK
jgi:hypothetical protein